VLYAALGGPSSAVAVGAADTTSRSVPLGTSGRVVCQAIRKILPVRLRAMLALAPKSIYGPSPMDGAQVFAAEGGPRMRIALMPGCAQQVLRPTINEATIRLLVRHGCEVVIAQGGGCCGALEHHMGRFPGSHAAAKRNIAAWEQVGDLDGIVINASGCGTTVKGYGHMLKDEPNWACRAKRIAGMTKDITEVMAELGVSTSDGRPVDSHKGMTIAYHSACSMQHGQKITELPKKLLRDAGYDVRSPPEGHLCCGSAGTYNMTQPVLAEQLGRRKAGHLANTGAETIATGNIGCLVQIGIYGDLPIVHTVELLDWASGGPKPSGLD
jgi:glycolate oxidase iron-sulfur subunit